MRAESVLLFGFLFTFARLSGVLAFVPLGAFRAAPEPARIVLALALTLMLWPQWHTDAAGSFTLGRILVGVAAEAALGVAIGLSLAVVLEVFQMAAQAITVPAGLGFASTIDPTSGADSTVLLTLADLTAGLLFFTSGADRLLVRALAESMRLAPPESFTIHRAWAPAMIRFAGSIFSVGLRLATPVIALLLLADVSLAVIGRVQAQIHLIGLTMPVKLAAVMLLLAATIVLQPSFMQSLMTSWTYFISGLLGRPA
jgi:flagellar biosynthetic protein FliR